jgi:hypothetical protein
MSMSIHLPPADGAVVLQSLRAALGDLADALVEVAGAYLRGKIATADNADVYQVQIHVVPDMLNPGSVPAGTGDAIAVLLLVPWVVFTFLGGLAAGRRGRACRGRSWVRVRGSRRRRG